MPLQIDDVCMPAADEASLGQAHLELAFRAGSRGEAACQAVPYSCSPMPQRTFSFLDARCQFALARVLLVVDRQRANRVAQQVWADVVDLAHGSELMEAPWQLQGERVLVKAFELGRELGQRHKPFLEAHDAQLLEWAATKHAQEEDARAARLEYEASAPSASALLASLRAGEQVELNGHSLEWDDEFETLAGSNPYGIDYYWGDMTEESLSRWRALMLRGETIGASPPYAEADEDDLPDLGATPEEEELHLELLALKDMAAWALLPDLEGVVPADETNS